MTDEQLIKALRVKYEELRRYNISCTIKCDELNVQNSVLRRQLDAAVAENRRVAPFLALHNFDGYALSKSADGAGGENDGKKQNQ